MYCLCTSRVVERGWRRRGGRRREKGGGGSRTTITSTSTTRNTSRYIVLMMSSIIIIIIVVFAGISIRISISSSSIMRMNTRIQCTRVVVVMR